MGVLDKLYEAIEKGDPESVKELCAEKKSHDEIAGSINTYYKSDLSLPAIAIQNYLSAKKEKKGVDKAFAVLKEVLKIPGIDLNTSIIPFAGGEPLISFAIEMGAPMEVLELLAEGKIDLNKPGKNGDRPLHYAVKADYGDALKLLLKKEADPSLKNGKGKKAGVTPLELSEELGLDHLTDIFNASHPKKSRPE